MSDKNFDLLIKASIDVGNKLTGKKIKDNSNTLHYVEGLGKKIIDHVLTSRLLMNGYSCVIAGIKYEDKFDFSSIRILTRAALETYLTFNHIFISPKTEEERKFRFQCWDLAGYLDRADFVIRAEEHKAIIEEEKKQIENLSNELKESSIFKSLTLKQQDKVLKGYWRIDKTWKDLATAANFGKQFFYQEYKYLCSYAHSSRLSIIQIQQKKTFNDNIMMLKAATIVFMITLAKFMFDYIEFIPELHEVKMDKSIYSLIEYWKIYGERL